VFVAIALTVEEVLVSLIPSCLSGGEAELPCWPPDAFALAASILKRSGDYTRVVSSWPPSKFGSRDSWRDLIVRVGDAWRETYMSTGKWPPEIDGWWKTIVQHRSTPIEEIGSNDTLIVALLGLVAASDRACFGFGILSPDSDDFELEALFQLFVNESLCKSIHHSRAVTLPKFHNPLDGLTIRSLTHNIALWDEPEVRAAWKVVDVATEPTGLNLLLLPWPLTVSPKQFQPLDRVPGLDLADEFGFFSYEVEERFFEIDRVHKLIENAARIVGRIDGVIFPEVSLTDREFQSLRDQLTVPIIIAGIASPQDERGLGVNQVAVCFNAEDLQTQETHYQGKHHRWRLDPSQVAAYGLGHAMSDKSHWWEAIRIGERTCSFFGVNKWLTFCALICEDLARQDPVAQLVRSVGPNLVIALLMDGPQVAQRWSARYATVLADDPRSSVLTLTSAGMVDLAISQDGRGPRSVGLWKDAHSPARPIVLNPKAEGVVVSLGCRMMEEWTADGRDDEKSTGYLALTGIHQVYPS
jgi:hypothetical protein